MPPPPIISCMTTNYGSFGPLAAIELVRSAGLEYVELPIHTADEHYQFGEDPLVSTASSLEDLKRVSRLLDANGVRLSSCTCMCGNPLDANVVALVCRKLDLAAHFGVRTIVTDAGDAERDGERQTLYRHLREIGDHAAKLGITVCFETHRGLCVNHREMLHVMTELQHAHLRINFDTANLLYYNQNANVEVALAKICHLVKHVHLKDSMGNFGEWYFPALGNGGAVDFLRVYQIMKVCRFPGPYSIEIEGIAGEPDQTLEQRHARVVASVNYLKHLGYFD